MPATDFIILRVTGAERDAIAAKAEREGGDIAAFLRKLLGLPPRRPGRPKGKAKPRPAK